MVDLIPYKLFTNLVVEINDLLCIKIGGGKMRIVALSVFFLLAGSSLSWGQKDVVNDSMEKFRRIANAYLMKKIELDFDPLSDSGASASNDKFAASTTHHLEVTVGKDLFRRHEIEKFRSLSGSQRKERSYEGIYSASGYVLNVDYEDVVPYAYSGSLDKSDKIEMGYGLLFGQIGHNPLRFDLTKKAIWDEADVENVENGFVIRLKKKVEINAPFPFDKISQLNPTLTYRQNEDESLVLENIKLFGIRDGENKLFYEYNHIQWGENDLIKGWRYSYLNLNDLPNEPRLMPQVDVRVNSCTKAVDLADDFPRFEFKNTRAPKFNSILLQPQTKIEYVLQNGKVSKAIDKTARDQILLIQEQHRESKLDCSDNSEIAYVDYIRKHSARHCGIYATAVVLAELGVEFDLDQVVLEEHVSTRAGSSANDIREIMRKFNIYGTAQKNVDINYLKQMNLPGVLHFSHGYQAESIDHWVAFLGFDKNGNARIVDLPRTEEAVRPADLLTYWDGRVILASKSPISTAHWFRSVVASRITLISFFASFFVAGGLVYILKKRKFRTKSQIAFSVLFCPDRICRLIADQLSEFFK